MATRLNVVRNAIDDSGKEQRLLKTFPRKGFRFVGSVREGRGHSGAPTPDISHEAPALAGDFSGRPSIIVLPFDNLSGDPSLNIFGEGFTEDVLTELSKFRELVLIASEPRLGRLRQPAMRGRSAARLARATCWMVACARRDFACVSPDG